jgi:thiol-disulfide isomerase/thioredoxin
MLSKRAFVLSATALSVAASLPRSALAGPAGPGAGDRPPDRVGRDYEGDPVQLKTFAGKAIVVSFWATWCPYCLKELPILQGIQKVVGEDKIRVIAVNTESRDTFHRAAKALKDLGLLMTYDPGRDAETAFGVNGLPHMVIVGRDGRILNVYRGYDESSLDAIVADINRAVAVQASS